MTKIGNIKKEFIKRVCWYHDNSPYILAYYRYKLSKQNIFFKNPTYYLENEELIPFANIFEEFFLGTTPLEETIVFQEVTNNELVKRQKDFNIEHYFPERLRMILDILFVLKDHITNQTGDIANKVLKLKAIDEYLKALTYDPKKNNPFTIYQSKISNPNRNPEDIGVTNNQFIRILANGFEEKIYQTILELNTTGELPLMTCQKSEIDLENRPYNITPCKKHFYVKEEEIVIKFNDDGENQFYYLCPHCGYIVEIPKEIVPEYIKAKNKDDFEELRFKHMLSTSELIAVKKTLKKIK